MQDIDLRFTTLKYPLPDFVYEGIQQYVKSSNEYFYQPEELRRKIAQKHGVPADMVYLTAGADQAINLLAQVYGQRTHVFTPTYVSYSDAKNFGHEFYEHDSLHDGQYRVSTGKINDATLIFLANPNNPAGLTSKQEVISLIENNADTVLAIDEVYAEMADESVIDQVASHKNLVIIRSFSKSYSLASFRIGYIIAHPEIIKSLVFETTWFNVAYPSVGAAMTAMDHEDYFAELREEVVNERAQTENFLSEKGYAVVPSAINAVMIHFDDASPASDFVANLKAKNILVNQGSGASNIGLDDSFVRISVGTPEQMQTLREVIDSAH